MKMIFTVILGAMISMVVSCDRQASPSGKSTKLNFQISGAT